VSSSSLLPISRRLIPTSYHLRPRAARAGSHRRPAWPIKVAVGSGPFGRRAAGSFNFTYDAPAHVLYLERSPRRIRAVIGGEVVADSTEARLLHETGLMPVYYLPEADVRADLLEPTDTTTHCPFKGDAAYRTVRVGDEVREDAVWTYPEPLDGAPPLTGLLAFDFHAVDTWYEEAEPIDVHPRDPYHRCDVTRSDRHVTIRFGGEVVAESDRASVLFETGLPPRYYLPAEDVRADLLEPSDTVTACPYKGTTSRYHTIRVGDEVAEDAIWVYDDPHDEVRAIAGLLAFYDDEVELTAEVDRMAPPPT
jgi:uncharacterized protein (DUF427 family)